MKKHLLIIFCIVLLAGCTAHQPEQLSAQNGGVGELPVKIRVLTESGDWTPGAKTSGVTRRINRVLRYYHKEHPNVEFEVETLPSRGSGERDTFIQSRRVALLAGETPDIYLLPTLGSAQINRPAGTTVKQNESLFRDVAQAQTNHWFADISALYDADEDLHTEELQKTVMDAGVVGDARYILPLGYSFDLLLADKAKWEEEPRLADCSSCTLEDLLATGDPGWIPDKFWWDCFPLNYLPQLADYAQESVLVDESQLSTMLKQLTKASQLSKERYKSFRPLGYMYFINDTQLPGTFMSKDNWCISTNLGMVVEGPVCTAKSEGQEVQMAPLKTADGQLVADITYWGAVSSSCDNIETAYDVLRLFLTPGIQHGTGLVCSDGTVQEVEPEDPTEDKWYPGWPVRYKGFVKAKWARCLEEIEMYHCNDPKRKEALLAVELDDNDFPILDEEISYARFTGTLDQAMDTLLEPLQWQAASDEEVKQIADIFLRDLKYHLAEG